MLRFTGWVLVALGAGGISVGLGFALPLIAGGLRGHAPMAGELALLGHSLAWPVATCGLVGLGLVRLADGPVCRPAAWVVAAAVAVAVLGGVVGAVPPSLWQASAPRIALLSQGAAAGGWTFGALGMLAMAIHRRAWPAPLAAALLAVAGHGVISGALDLWVTAQDLADPLTLQLGTFASPATWLLAGGVLAEVAREVVHAPLGDDPPSGIDRAFLVLWVLLSAGTLVAGWGAFPPAAGALVLSLVAVTAYAIDAGLSGSLRPRIEQPLGFLLIMLWSFGLLGVAALRSYADVALHDTYAELAVGHLLGPMLASVALLTGAAAAIPEPVSRGPTTWFPWLGVALCVVLTGIGLWRITSGFVALGMAGMARRYFVYPPGTSSAWVDLGVGAALFGLGAVATTLVIFVLAGWRARAGARVRAAAREAEKVADAARQRSVRSRR